MSTEVGIRELRQNLSVYLRRVAAGEHFTVTDHNRPVAQLGPPPDSMQEYERLCRELNVRRAIGPWWEMEPFERIKNTSGMTLEEILEEQRADRL
jgi:prevent-host-death family protein